MNPLSFEFSIVDADPRDMKGFVFQIQQVSVALRPSESASQRFVSS
jgi:hypothetical protein